MPKKIQYHWEIDAYKLSVEAAMEIYHLSKSFPSAEYRLIQNIRHSSRAVSGRIAKGFRRRKYQPGFVEKINSASEAAEKTQQWLTDCVKSKSVEKETASRLHDKYQKIKAKLQHMAQNPKPWVLKPRTKPS
jgi:four helix bundle protein